MAVARLLLAISALISVISLQVVYGGIVCEKLPVEACAFSVSPSGARCVLEKSILRDDNVQYECQTSEIIAENMNELIETEECMNACGLERMTVGMSTDSLAERGFTKKLCSPRCYNNCPNIVDLYFNLAAGEGIYLPRLCEAHRSGDRRMMTEFVSFAVAPVTIGFGDSTISPASAPVTIGFGDPTIHPVSAPVTIGFGDSIIPPASAPVTIGFEDPTISPTSAPSPVSS